MAVDCRARKGLEKLAGALVGAEVALITRDPTTMPDWDHESPGVVFDSIDDLWEPSYPGYRRAKLGPAVSLDGVSLRWEPVEFRRDHPVDDQPTQYITGWVIVARDGRIVAGGIVSMIEVASYSGASHWICDLAPLAPGSTYVVAPEFAVESFGG